jgi:2-polyprenyl-6-methoxyphenol hydroxylase-like FAD-dependent oxidoreductase
MDADVDVIVAGAGPAGLMLAGDLARAGVSCAVLERKPERSGLSRAFAVHSRTLEVLDARGVADELVATGTPVPEMRLFGGAALDLSRLPSRFGYVLVTPQYETERVLEDRARSLGASIRYGQEVTGVTQLADGAAVEIAGAGQLRARYVVGADGIHSTIRRSLGIPFPGKAVVRSMMLAEVRLTKQPPDALTGNASGNAFAFMAPLDDGWYRVIAWHRRHQAAESDPVSLKEVSDTATQAFGVDYGMHDPRWMSRFHCEERQAPRYRDGRVLLAGDAAHVHSPVGGLGMNTGIQDAANLGWKLAADVAGRAPNAILDSYETERHPVGRQVLRASGALLRVRLIGPRPVVAATGWLAPAAMRIPFITKRMAGTFSGLSICYPVPAGSHPLAGKRVPDWPLADGRRLYEALRGGRFLLASSSALPADVAEGYAGQVDTVAISDGGIPPGGPGASPGIIALIRPDAYIAEVISKGDSLAIRAALARWCGSA